jgi:hypothetical protein
MTLQIDILNPKAKKLLKDLADLNLISIRNEEENDFMKTVAKLRKNEASDNPSIEFITKEVELVRNKRYAQKKA